MNLLPQILRRWRTRHGLSQSQAAARLGVKIKTLQNWEHGRNRPGALAIKQLEQMIAR